jgi:D-lactate dehydrogenase
MDIFFYEAFAEEADALRQHMSSSIDAGYTWKTIQEYGADEPPAAVISIRTQSALPAQWATQLRAVLSRSTGYDHLLDYRNGIDRDLALGYLPLYCHRAVAEQAMLLWMALLRKLDLQVRNFTKFHRDGLTGHEAQGKTLLVVGVGNIGSEVYRIGRGLGMNVLGVDIVQDKTDVHYVSLAQGLRQADIIVAAMNLTPTNRGYFGYEVLRNAKRGAVFVNISRGEFSPSSDLLKLLREGHLGGVALDVYNQEPKLARALRSGSQATAPELRATLALAEMENVILTPHNAFNTEEAVQRKAEHSARQVAYFLAEGRFLWPVPTE